MVTIKTPKEFFGKQPGADRVMIHWHQLCAYYREVAASSDRVLLEEMGKTSEGNDFLILYVSSPENLARLEEYRQISMTLADPRELSEAEIDALAQKGRAIVFQSYGLHSNEVGGPQMVPLMLHELVTSDSPRIKRMLDEVIFIISPCSEPDGEIVFTDWYDKYFGTEFEGICSPYMRHNWAGHANNRDALRECVVESRYLNDILVRRFMPQIFQDHHHQCPDENRMSIAPKCDPICEHIHPLVHREMAMYGAHMAMELSAAGRKGVVAGDPFFSDFPISSFYGASCLHNIAGMLTENADVRIATPDYIDPETLKLCTAREHILEPCAICPDPWEGGWWHLSDIVEQMYIASMALVDYAACNRVRILKAMAQKALLQTKRGAESEIKAYLISPKQHDLSAAKHLIQLLRNQRIDLYTLTRDVVMDGQIYPKGSVYVPLAQPKYAVIQVMLSETPYSHQAEKELASGKPRLSDTANICMALTFGVETKMLPREIASDDLATFDGCFDGWARPMAASENASYRALNQALASGARVARDASGNFVSLTDGDVTDLRQLRRAKVGLLKVSFTGNEEEAFTRNLLRDYGFDYRIVMDAEIRERGIPEDIEVMIFPAHPPIKLCFGDEVPEGCPKEYQTGIGAKGRVFLREFVERGGRLVTWEKSCGVINDWLRLGLVDRAAELDSTEYFTGGSVLNATVARENDPLTCGMSRQFTLTHNNGPILVPADFAGKVEILATIRKDHALKNGVARGIEHLAGTPCVLRTKKGKGEVILFTFSPQFRVQQEATFKLLFNALYLDANE
ncbi:MAG: hypothetical protein IJW30_01175 [Clostridia bacterium]|nr:hypothetical protein [Clostridia bacterium]